MLYMATGGVRIGEVGRAVTGPRRGEPNDVYRHRVIASVRAGWGLVI